MKSELGPASAGRALRHAGTVAGLLTLVARELGRIHLVTLASTLARELAVDVDGLRSLRLPVDLLAAFPHWREGSANHFTPRSLGLRLSPDRIDRALPGLRLHVSPRLSGAALLFNLLHDLRNTLDRSTPIAVLVDSVHDPRSLRRAASNLFGPLPHVRFVAVDFGSLFARDSALAARDRRDRPVLFVPRRLPPDHRDKAEALDRRAAERTLGVRVMQSRLHWQAGNILFDGRTLAVGADTIAENVSRLGLSIDEVTKLLSAEFGHAITVLGDPAAGRVDDEYEGMRPSGQASYHIDLDVALVGASEPTALVADERLGLSLLPAALASRALERPSYLESPSRVRKLIVQEYRTGARQRARRLQQYRDALIARGYRVVSVPDLRTRALNESVAGVRDISYCNVLAARVRGRSSLLYAAWGIPALDAAAVKAYGQAGATPIRIGRAALAPAMMERAAGLRCYCGAMP